MDVAIDWNWSVDKWSPSPVGEHKDYSNASELEVVSRARELVGKSLRDLYGSEVGSRKGKGAFGQLLEQLHFGYAPNSLPEVDFPVARLELKTTGAEARKNGWFAKERLVLSNINYSQLAEDDDFLTSSFYLKNARLLLVVYYWLADTSPFDNKVIGVGVVDLEELDAADRAIIEDDWKKIQDAVKAGRAHEMSEGHTMYLKATRKGAGTGRDDRKQPFSSIPAPNRAFSFKQSFLTRLLQPFVRDVPLIGSDVEQPLVKDPAQLRTRSFDEVVLGRLDPFSGRTVESIMNEIDPELNRESKGFYADLARRMLGVTSRRIEEFEKADVIMKTVRVNSQGMPREHMSFPAFKYRDLVEQDWFESDLREALSKRFLFIFYEQLADQVRFHHAAFWAMPETVLDGEVKRVWDTTVNRIKTGRATELPRSTDSDVAHVRPHGRNALDTDETPQGRQLMKKSFWLNKSFISQIFKSTAGN